MKFLGDMGISIRTIEWLRRQGYEAVHLREEGLQRLPDPEVLEKAQAEGRILLTMDLDFGYLLAVSKERLPGVIIFRLTDESSANVNARITEVFLNCTDALRNGAVISVNDSAIRVRLLPIQ